MGHPRSRNDPGRTWPPEREHRSMSGTSFFAPLLGTILVATLVHFALAIALRLWGRRVAGLHSRRLFGALSWLPTLSAVLGTVGLAAVVLSVIRAVGLTTRGAASPAQQAELLANAVSQSINGLACTMILIGLLWFPIIGLCLWGEVSAQRLRKP